MMINHPKMTFLYIGSLLFVNQILNMNKTCTLEMLIQLNLKIPIMNMLKILVMKILKILMMKTVKWSNMNNCVILPFLWYKTFLYLILMSLDVLKTHIMPLISKGKLSQMLHF